MTLISRLISRASLLVVVVAPLGACVARPEASVLQPVQLSGKAERTVSVIAATNRQREGAGFTGSRADAVTYEQYLVSVPLNRKSAAIVYPDAKHPDPKQQFIVETRTPISKAQLVQNVTSKNFDGTVGIFVHGYNYSYQEALFRAAQVAADVHSPSPPILFSWPSVASVSGYVADRDAVLASRTELQDLIINVSSSPKVKQIVLFGHSMGGFLAMEAVRQLRFQGRQSVLDKLAIILAAPDIDVDVFRSQLADIGPMKTPMTLLVAKTDRALQFSSLIAGQRPRVGRVDIQDSRMQTIAKRENLRVVDITSIHSDDGLGHDRYAFAASYGRQLSTFETEAAGGRAIRAHSCSTRPVRLWRHPLKLLAS